MDLIVTLIISISFYLLINVSIDAANISQCDCSCGYIAANSSTLEMACPQTGNTGTYALRIIWDDGSYSDASIQFVSQSVVGSCCSHNVGRGSIIGGSFAGQPATIVSDYRDNKLECLSCQTKSRIGVSHFTGLTFLEIGSQSTTNSKRCKGIIDFFFSPALTSAVQLVTFTYQVKYTECTNCTDDC